MVAVVVGGVGIAGVGGIGGVGGVSDVALECEVVHFAFNSHAILIPYLGRMVLACAPTM
jgi:hypothetical protein